MDDDKLTEALVSLLTLSSMSFGFAIATECASVTLDDKGNHVIDWTEARAVLKEKTAKYHASNIGSAQPPGKSDGADFVSWESRGRVLANVDSERIRQEELKASGRFAYTCADAECTDGQALAILVEEVGEVARAMCEGKGLRDELIQVAAVAVAWVERLDNKVEELCK